MEQLTTFDAVDYLDSDEMIVEYLSAALESGDSDLLLAAIRNAAKAKGMTELSRATGLGRESMYKTLRPGAKPRFETLSKILRALGVRFSVQLISGDHEKIPA